MPAIKQALIIAAGNGSRLQPSSGELPKPLTPLAGVPLLKRLLLNLARAGIERCVIVLGYQGEKIQRTLNSESWPLQVTTVMNEEWRKSNGVSVLKAKEHLHEDFVLLMADHLFQVQTLARFLRRRPSPGEVILAVDRKIDQIYDIDDATKVELNGTKILSIGKDLKKYTAVDTGMFLCTPSLFLALDEKFQEKGDCSLTDGMKRMIEESKLRFFDIKDDWWQDVDTPGALRHAERILFSHLPSFQKGWISRNIYRPLSMKLTRRLLTSPFSSAQACAMSVAIALFSALLISFANYWSVLLGVIAIQGALLLNASAQDLSRLQLQEGFEDSPAKMFQGLMDKAVYLLFLAGICLGFYRLENAPYVFIVGCMTLFDAALIFSLVNFRRLQEPAGLPAPLQLLTFAIRREFLVFAALLLAVLGQLGAIFWASFVVTHLTALVLFYGQSRLSPVVENSAEIA